MIRRWLEAKRCTRGKFLEIRAAFEIGGRSPGCDAGTAEGRRSAANVVLPQDAGRPFVPCIAAANREAKLLGEIIREIGKNRIGFGINFGVGKGGEACHGRKQTNVKQRIGLGIKIIEANQTVQLVAFIEQLEFLTDLFVPIDAGYVEIDRWQCVKIDRCRCIIFAPSADRAKRHGVAEIGTDIHRQAISFNILHRIVESAACVEDIVQHRRPGTRARDQPVAAARIAFILGIVAGNADQDRLTIAADFKRAATGPDILVIIFQAVGQIVAEAATREPRTRCADPDHAGNRHAGSNHRFCLIISTIGGPRLERRFVRQPFGYIFDRTADGVAPVERALRAAQDFDPFDIINVENGGLWPVEIDIVEIDADALLETRNRVLLADAANEGGERRVGSARRFQRCIGRCQTDIGDVDRTLLFQFFG